MTDEIKRLQASAGAHIHTANKAMFYHEYWTEKNRQDLLTRLNNAVDLALVGDWKPLQTLLRGLW